MTCLKLTAKGAIGAALLFFASSTTAHAASLFSQTFTGAEIADFATDPTNVDINGDVADFTVTNDTAGTALIVFDILSPGERGGLILSLDVDFVPLPGSISDNDPLFGFTDQTNSIFTQRQNNSGGTHAFRAVGPDQTLVTALTGLGAVTPFSVSFTVGDELGPVTGSVTEGTASVTDQALPYTFDTDGVIGFRLNASNANEGYRLNSITINIDEVAAVPLPGGLVLMLSAFGALFIRRVVSTA